MKQRPILNVLKKKGPSTLREIADALDIQDVQGKDTISKVLNKCRVHNKVLHNGRLWQLSPDFIDVIELPAVANPLPVTTKVWRVVRGLGAYGKCMTASHIATLAEVDQADAESYLFLLCFYGLLKDTGHGFQATQACQLQVDPPDTTKAFAKLLATADLISKLTRAANDANNYALALWQKITGA